MGAAMQSQRDRISADAKKLLASESQSVIGIVSGYDPLTGTYEATTPDGGVLPVSLGNYGAPPSQVSIVSSQNSLVGFADYKAP
jgi:hypothetical protein